MLNPRKKGLIDWWQQRISAVLIALYIVPLTVLWFGVHPVTVSEWHHILFNVPMRILGSLSALAILVHAAIGFWVVATDYVKSSRLRTILTRLVHVFLGVFSLMMLIFIWSVQW